MEQQIIRLSKKEFNPLFGILNSHGKMMTCYLRDTNTFLRYRNLCVSILKCGFPTKSIELTWLVLFEVLGVPQLLRYLGLDHFVKLSSKKFYRA